MKIKPKQPITSRTDFFYYAFRNILLVSLPLAIICGLVLSHLSFHSSATSSTSSSDHVYFTLDTSCTMSGELISPHTVEIHGGQYKTNVGTTKLNTYCNDGNGYSIYAIGSSNNIDGNNYLINSDNNNYNISTGIYDSSTATTNTPSSWSMKLIAGTGTGNTLTPPNIVNGYDNYSIIPNTYTQVAKRTSETEMNTNTDVTGSYLTTTYAIYASSIQPAGSYSGNVKYVMIHPHVNDNNIGFNEAFVLSGKSSVGSYYAMQDMTSDICNMVNIYDEPSQTQLIDTRDGKTYWVAKLRDNHCWMTQNLDFDIIADEQDPIKMKTLTSEDTDLTDHSLTGAYSQANGYSYDENTGITTWTPVGTAKTINFYDAAVYGWANSYTAPSSANKADSSGIGHSSLGNYYSWAAAVASNNTNGLSGNANNSICPKNWRLPSTSSYEFNTINSLYNSSLVNDSGLTVAPLWLIKSGDINNTVLENFVAQGSYWSSTVRSGGSANALYFNDNKVDPAGETSGGNKRLGFPIRCLSR